MLPFLNINSIHIYVHCIYKQVKDFNITSWVCETWMPPAVTESSKVSESYILTLHHPLQGHVVSWKCEQPLDKAIKHKFKCTNQHCCIDLHMHPTNKIWKPVLQFHWLPGAENLLVYLSWILIGPQSWMPANQWKWFPWVWNSRWYSQVSYTATTLLFNRAQKRSEGGKHKSPYIEHTNRQSNTKTSWTDHNSVMSLIEE